MLLTSLAARAAAVAFEAGQRPTARAQSDQLAEPGTPARDYAPTPWPLVRSAFRAAGLGRDDVVVDFGSGRGRAVCYLARRYPVRRVIGIERDDALAGVARQNAELLRNRLRAGSVDLVTADVRAFPVPRDLTCAYFYNPFPLDIFSVVLTKIMAVMDQRSGPLKLVYVHPKEHQLIMDCGRFREVLRRGPATALDRCFVIYESR